MLLLLLDELWEACVIVVGLAEIVHIAVLAGGGLDAETDFTGLQVSHLHFIGGRHLLRLIGAMKRLSVFGGEYILSFRLLDLVAASLLVHDAQWHQALVGVGLENIVVRFN